MFCWRRCPGSSLSHLSQVQDKSVSIVETLPAAKNLHCLDNISTFDVQQPLNVHIVGHHMFKARGHAPFLWDRVGTQSGSVQT